VGAAAVGGAGYYAGKKISEGRQDDDFQDQQIADLQDQSAYQQPAAAPPPAPTPAPQDDSISQLERLGALKDQGVLTEEEFQAQKAKILGT
jgi:hypothetical protein